MRQISVLLWNATEIKHLPKRCQHAKEAFTRKRRTSNRDTRENMRNQAQYQRFHITKAEEKWSALPGRFVKKICALETTVSQKGWSTTMQLTPEFNNISSSRNNNGHNKDTRNNHHLFPTSNVFLIKQCGLFTATGQEALSRTCPQHRPHFNWDKRLRFCKQEINTGGAGSTASLLQLESKTESILSNTNTSNTVDKPNFSQRRIDKNWPATYTRHLLFNWRKGMKPEAVFCSPSEKKKICSLHQVQQHRLAKQGRTKQQRSQSFAFRTKPKTHDMNHPISSAKISHSETAINVLQPKHMLDTF